MVRRSEPPQKGEKSMQKSMREIVSQMRAKPSKPEQTFHEMRQAFIDRGAYTVEALGSRKSFQHGDRIGWVSVQIVDNDDSENEPHLLYKVRPGYGNNNQFVQDDGDLLSEDSWFWTTDPNEALSVVECFLEAAINGQFDDGLKAIFKKHKRMVEVRTLKLANTAVQAETVVSEGADDEAA
jgi:hypothetical protein